MFAATPFSALMSVQSSKDAGVLLKITDRFGKGVGQYSNLLVFASLKHVIVDVAYHQLPVT